MDANGTEFSPARLAPKPGKLQETGLSQTLLEQLVAKHLHESGALDLGQLVERLALPGAVVEPLINFMRKEGGVELRRRVDDSIPHYALTDKGQAVAVHALAKNSYVGPAPVPLETYLRVVQAQTVRNYAVSQEHMRSAFGNVVIREDILNQLGPALHSGRAVFLYGVPGTGKSYIGRRLVRLFEDAVLVPHAVAVRDIVIPFFDPTLHHPVSDMPAGGASASLTEGHDVRFVLSHRPVVVTGGELSLNMLEIQYDESRKQYRMPVQVLANNGIFMIDDLGRQRVSPVELLNRWIVPMEEKRDYLHISGQHFAVLLDVVLIFATNMNPLELADEAFLRRIGYKVKFSPLEAEEYTRLWQQVCEERGVAYRAEVVRYVQEELHKPRQIPLLPCHPRDLLDLTLDYCRYLGSPNEMSKEALKWAWNTYFVRLEQSEGG